MHIQAPYAHTIDTQPLAHRDLISIQQYQEISRCVFFFLCNNIVKGSADIDFTVRFPYSVLLKVTQPLVCKCQRVPSHLPANRHEDLWGKWGVTYGPTHARLRKLLLWCGELIGLRVGKQPLVPDVDCKYPAVVYSTHVGAWLSLQRLSCNSGWLLLFSAHFPRHIGRCTLDL